MATGGESNYKSGIKSAVRGYWSGIFDYGQFLDSMGAVIDRGIQTAWYEGAQEMGISPADLSTDERDALRRFIADEYTHLRSFADFIDEHSRAEGGKLATVFARAELWVQRYNRVREVAKTMTATNPPLRWIFGATEEHCDDCSRVAGRVYRKDTWDRYGWVPGSRALACGGWRCDCRRIPAPGERITPGRPPSMIGPR